MHATSQDWAKTKNSTGWTEYRRRHRDSDSPARCHRGLLPVRATQNDVRLGASGSPCTNRQTPNQRSGLQIAQFTVGLKRRRASRPVGNNGGGRIKRHVGHWVNGRRSTAARMGRRRSERKNGVGGSKLAIKS